MIAEISSFNAAQCKDNITVAVTAVRVLATAIDIGLEATSRACGAGHLRAFVLRFATTAFSNIKAGITFETTLHHCNRAV